jgi:agmatinase
MALLWKSLYKIEEADWIVLGIPWEGSVYAKNGTSKAPSALRKWFQNCWTYDHEERADLTDRKVVDVGNVAVGKTYSQTAKNIAKKIKDIREKNKKAKILFIGGDHSITPPITKSLGIDSFLMLDAHLDLTSEYEGDKNSPACTARRVHEQGVDVNILGVRTGSEEEYKFADKVKWDEKIKFRGSIDYLSIDVDVMDPIYIGTGSPEALGVKPEDVLKIISDVKFKYCDITEWIPDRGYPVMVSLVKNILWKD